MRFPTVVLHAAAARAALRQFSWTLHGAARSPDGFERNVYLINGQQPGPLIDVDEGDTVEVFVQNDLDVDTTMHWHGLLQRGTPQMDGVPGVTQDAIPPGGNFTYRFTAGPEYGFYWYHSHQRAYYNDAVRGPLLIRPAAWRARPFARLGRGEAERAALLAAERGAANVMLNDWTHEASDVLLVRYRETGAFPYCVDSILANGRGRVECLPESVLRAGARVARRHAAMAGAGSLTPRGCAPPSMFKPGYSAASLPRETCTNTTAERLDVAANATRGWLALNLVNAGAVSALRVSLDGHSMTVYAADGLYVEPQEVEVLHMELGQRYSVMVRLDQEPGRYALRYATFPSGDWDMQQVLEGRSTVTYAVSGAEPPAAEGAELGAAWTFVNGSARAGASVLDAARLAPFESGLAPPRGPARETLAFVANQTDMTTWAMGSRPFEEPATAVIHGSRSAGWAAETTYHLAANATVDIVVSIAETSMDQMGHPLHLHGHKFWVLGSGPERAFPYASVADAPSSVINMADPPYRDTTALPAQGWVVIRYVTDNVGAWLFHCHLQWHAVSGMSVVLVEGADELPRLLGQEGQPAAAAAATAAGEADGGGGGGGALGLAAAVSGMAAMALANPMALLHMYM